MTINGHIVTFPGDGRILIDGVRFRDWLLTRRLCPFCGADLRQPQERYHCDCDGWRIFKARRPIIGGGQMKLI